MEQRKRKVGQDFVVKKKTVSNLVIKKQGLSVDQEKSQIVKKIIKQPVVPPRPESSITKRQEQILKTLESRDISQQKNIPTKGGVLWYIVGLLFIVLFLTVSSFIGTVNTVITLEEFSQEINENILIYKEPKDGQLGYNTATVVEQYEHVPTSEIQESVSEKALGTIKVINKENKIVTIPKGTIVVSSTEKMFVTLEEKKVLAGSEQKPSSADIPITAQSPGEEFNIGFDDFILQGFQNITARTVKEVTGGFIGSRPVINDSDRLLAQNIVRSKFENSKPDIYLTNQIPSEFILPSDLITVSDIEISESVQNGKIHFIGKRTIEGILLKKEEVFNQLEYLFITSEDLQLDKEKTNIHFSLLGSPESEDFSVVVSGDLITRYSFDEQSAKLKFLGKKVKEINYLGREFPGIIDISTKVTPPWLFTVPAKQGHFTLELRYLEK